MKKLYLSRDDRKICGLCGGLAEMFNIDSTLVRLCAVFAALATGLLPFVLTYIIAYIILPQKPLPGTGGNNDSR